LKPPKLLSILNPSVLLETLWEHLWEFVEGVAQARLVLEFDLREVKPTGEARNAVADANDRMKKIARRWKWRSALILC